MPSENQKDNVDLLVLKNCEPGHGLFTKYVKRYTIAGGATKDKSQDPAKSGTVSFVASRPGSLSLDPAKDGV